MSNNCQPAPNGNLFICNILIYNKKISGLEIASYSAFRKGTGVPFAIKQQKQDTLTNRLSGRAHPWIGVSLVLFALPAWGAESGASAHSDYCQ